MIIPLKRGKNILSNFKRKGVFIMSSGFYRYKIKDFGISLESTHYCNRWNIISMSVSPKNSRDTRQFLKHINFYFNDIRPGPPDFDWDKHNANVYLPLIEYQKYVDLLKSEEKVRLKVYSAAKRIVLETGLEDG